MFIINKDGKYITPRGHRYDPPVLSDDLQDARTFVTEEGAKSSRFRIMEENPIWVEWYKARAAHRKGDGWSSDFTMKRPAKDTPLYTDKLKDGYKIIEVQLYVV